MKLFKITYFFSLCVCILFVFFLLNFAYSEGTNPYLSKTTPSNVEEVPAATNKAPETEGIDKLAPVNSSKDLIENTQNKKTTQR